MIVLRWQVSRRRTISPNSDHEVVQLSLFPSLPSQGCRNSAAYVTQPLLCCLLVSRVLPRKPRVSLDMSKEIANGTSWQALDLLLVERCRSDTQSNLLPRPIELTYRLPEKSVDTTPGLVDLANLGLHLSIWLLFKIAVWKFSELQASSSECGTFWRRKALSRRSNSVTNQLCKWHVRDSRAAS